MTLQTILEIAVGLFFTWLMLSIAAMYIQEWFGTQLRWRSNMLEAYISNMLTDPALADQFYDHPLIKSLHTGEGDDMRRPAYIPARMFTMTLFDIVINAGKKTSILQQEVFKLRSTMDKLKKDEKARANAQFKLVLAAARKALNTKTGEAALENAVANIKLELEILGKINPLLQEAVEQTLSKVDITAQDVDTILKGIDDARKQSAEKAGVETGDSSTMEQLRDGIAILSATNPQLKQALESLLLGVEEYGSRGENALAMARQNVETWFDDGMDRLSGWYKRYSQKIAILVGISVAVVLNADTLAMAQTLWREPIIRQALVSQAEAFAQKNQDGLQPMTADEFSTLPAEFSTLNIPIGWIGTPLPVDSGGGITMMDGSQKHCTFWPASPIDYYGIKVGQNCYSVINAPVLNDPTGIFLKTFGLLVSGLAAAQGAPFWFDILKKVINIRTTGVNPSETKPAG
jgi:hypothetical protein